MNKLETIEQVRKYVGEARKAGRRIGFVPTMGALHEGHRSLMRAARAACDEVIVSIFVNPTQFGPGEDFERYPRPLEADLAACREEGVGAAFCPSVAEMYPPDSVTTVTVSRLTEGLCGAHRPGHFNGVTTVVTKLFNIVQPDVAFFGQKDAQQAAVIRRMVRDLCMPVEIVVCPTVREPDGLAISSRNSYLSAGERAQALSLSAALRWAEAQVRAGQRDVESLVREMRRQIDAAGPCGIDYIEIVDADDLRPKAVVEGRCLIALAVRIGNTRLIDNMVVEG
ncbi:MAG TPA: pantoate--beta-alanine ligase [Phycisphaerae bacterium]|jgi:pantoate--beta-alanine ligase|nr:pantoate--beta-alanine ligase [Phycisphaerae bacterium]HOB75950.1 pantoate--beta-alanine ligase [Phycisphaerae bacterium]HOJ55556.1 pantoate--beta-alanine ligase [Phycisphaerae bacterium]HOL27588.1 pantoate--beta-alanine ligase [Phycisphaerae bacterium]HPP21830.1 pantoate--beta-alanine ligase [Phycisphaerae bacterium]